MYRLRKKTLGFSFSLHLLPDNFQNVTERYTSLYCFCHLLCCALPTIHVEVIRSLEDWNCIWINHVLQKSGNIFWEQWFSKEKSETSSTLSFKCFSGVSNISFRETKITWSFLSPEPYCKRSLQIYLCPNGRHY